MRLDPEAEFPVQALHHAHGAVRANLHRRTDSCRDPGQYPRLRRPASTVATEPETRSAGAGSRGSLSWNPRCDMTGLNRPRRRGNTLSAEMFDGRPRQCISPAPRGDNLEEPRKKHGPGSSLERHLKQAGSRKARKGLDVPDGLRCCKRIGFRHVRGPDVHAVAFRSDLSTDVNQVRKEFPLPRETSPWRFPLPGTNFQEMRDNPCRVRGHPKRLQPKNGRREQGLPETPDGIRGDKGASHPGGAGSRGGNRRPEMSAWAEWRQDMEARMRRVEEFRQISSPRQRRAPAHFSLPGPTRQRKGENKARATCDWFRPLAQGRHGLRLDPTADPPPRSAARSRLQ